VARIPGDAMTAYRELLIGCGHRRQKQINPWKVVPEAIRPDVQTFQDWQGLVTLDYNEDCKPDILCDLDHYPLRTYDARIVGGVSLPSDQWDEIHAYEVLEHLGQQGNFRAFLALFEELWRILKPGGFLCATVPSRYSEWLWGDPGHTRAITPNTLLFLSQDYYRRNLGNDSSSDYRRFYSGDFDRIYTSDNRDSGVHSFVLRAVKPSRAALPARV
jgi:SAM-dependent methyltransferase